MGVPYELRAHMVSLLIVLTITAVSIMVFILAKPGRLNPQRIVKLGLYYEVFGSVGIAFATVYGETNFENIWGVSAICIWVIAYVGFVPLPPNKATIAAFTSAAMGPLALAVWAVVAGLPVPSAAVFFGLSVPIFVCAAMASIGARMLYQLGKNVDRALQMGSYRLERLLGRGGMGEVWLARHQMLVRPAAIKLVRPDFWGGDLSEVVFRRFEREAQATASLTSPHTIQLYDFGFTKEGIFYYVMELLEGTDLDSLVKRFGPLPPARATRFLQQACLSLAEAHARGMVHRDIKPANMYTCCLGLDYDFVKLLDFGLVRPLKKADGDEARLTIQGFPPGTPGYMAPEVVSGREADEGADIYALGCVGYWLITGRPVFEGATILEVLMNHVHSPPPSPSERVHQEIPKELEKIILWCLEKDPSNRPESVEELKRHLDSFALKDPWTQDRAREWWSQHGQQLAGGESADRREASNTGEAETI